MQLGRQIILPSSYSVYLHIDISKTTFQYIFKYLFFQNFQDGIWCINLNYGPPDLFFTFPANLYWQEIKDNLRANETFINRPDLCTRVLRIKFREFLDVIGNKNFCLIYL